MDTRREVKSSQTKSRGELGSLCLHVRWRRPSLQDSHEEMQFPKGTTVAAAEPRLVLDDVADVFQLLVAQLAFMEPAKKTESRHSMNPQLLKRCACSCSAKDATQAGENRQALQTAWKRLKM